MSRRLMSASKNAYGLTREALEKIEASYTPEIEQQTMNWVQAVIGREVYTKTGYMGVHELLKDGTLLCELVNKIEPGSIKKINTSSIAFKQMENIEKFLMAITKYGVNGSELFQTVDLFEAQNMTQVMITLNALGRKAQSKGFNGPCLGPKEAEKNERHFTEEKLAEGKNVIGLQMAGSTGANASGINMGKTRKIMD